MAAILNVLQHRRRVQRVPRVARNRDNHLDTLSDAEIVKRYRLDRGGIEYLCQELNEDLRRPTRRSNALPVPIQITAALRYFATGSFQAVTGDTIAISRFSVSRCVHRVADSLITRLLQRHVHFPSDNLNQRVTKEAFFEFGHFPNVLGTVDGTLIPLKGPSQDEHLYICRKGYHALNVQGVIGPDGRFLDIVARWPGSTHDSVLWRNCALCRKMSEGRITGGWLLGDSAYGIAPGLLTPVANPVNREHRAYNRAYRTTRSVVERGFGMWKLRFRCLHKTGGCLMFSPARCLKVIVATAILHNICIERNVDIIADDDDVPDNEDLEEEGEHEDDNIQLQDERAAGVRTRNELIQGHFMA